MTGTDQKWDRHAIKAEVERRGMSLTSIAIEAGLYKSACRQGLMGTSRAGAEAIAAALGIPFRSLFPTQYVRGRYNEEKPSPTHRSRERQKSTHDAVKKGAAA